MMRKELDDAATMALAVISSSDTPDWLKDLGWRTYADLAYHLQFNDWYSDTAESTSGLLLLPGSYQYQVEAFLSRLPDEITQQDPVDVILAREAAKAVDMHGHSVDFRLECAASLNRTLWRLIDHAEDCESFDSVLRESSDFLGHLARITAGVDADDDEIDDETDDFERGYNRGTTNYERL